MPVSSHKLAVALAERLNEVVPAAFQLRAENSEVSLYIDGNWKRTSFTSEIVDDETRELAERLHTVGTGVLNSVQDSISEHLRTPWPSADGRQMALPEGRVDTEALRLWYGQDESSAVVGLRPIRIAEVMA